VNKELSESQYRENAEVVSSMLREDFQEFGSCGRSFKSQSVLSYHGAQTNEITENAVPGHALLKIVILELTCRLHGGIRPQACPW
jgi:hypothetical protein